MTKQEEIDACEEEVRQVLAKHGCTMVCEHIERGGKLVGIAIHAIKVET